MIKNYLTIVFVAALILAGTCETSSAQLTASRNVPILESTTNSDSLTVDKIKANVLVCNMCRTNIVRLKMLDGKEMKGYIERKSKFTKIAGDVIVTGAVVVVLTAFNAANVLSNLFGKRH